MIKIFDTTLRDGEQSPGFAMNMRQKLLLAKQLEKLGVDVIEAGFPNASPEDFESVKSSRKHAQKWKFAPWQDAMKKILKRHQALKTAAKPSIHVFIATSDIHLKHKLKISRDQAIEKAVMGVKMARSFTSLCRLFT